MDESTKTMLSNTMGLVRQVAAGLNIKGILEAELVHAKRAELAGPPGPHAAELFAACAAGDVPEVERLLAAGADAVHCQEQWTPEGDEVVAAPFRRLGSLGSVSPFLAACQQGHTAVVELLSPPGLPHARGVERFGVGLDQLPDSFGQTPLSIAAQTGQLAVCRHLVEQLHVDVERPNLKVSLAPVPRFPVVVVFFLCSLPPFLARRATAIGPLIEEDNSLLPPGPDAALAGLRRWPARDRRLPCRTGRRRAR
eukprot:SAG22_NODE_138_length_18031_cov_5.796621_16_plen_253_part_00